MASQTEITAKLKLRAEGIKEATAESEKLNKSLERGRGIANNPKKAALAPTAMESIQYGQARASGGTGAAGRDFANQAQGLGGLVRLYATYAANLFAVSAAFGALREAMDTTMMIRGLDQLGAASGVAMGGLAKQFAQASDGAISLREAMEATAKATTSGLSSKQFLELGMVAKGASQALGVNMSDAVSRLTRGITKLEPELLDELGIFTKVGKATEDYARSVGKSAASLTDFERRQAFANAVLEEGKQKFREIAQESNPYDKLLASLKNVAQGILESINSIVGPIAKLFANNTELIGLAIAAAALKITQQAMPALSQWRKGLADAAQDAAKRASEINTSFGEAFVKRAEIKQRIPQIDLAIQQAEAEFKAAKQQFVELDNVYKRPNATLKALQQDRLLNDKELSAIKTDITKKTNLNTEAELKHALSLTNVQAAQQKIVELTKERAKAYDEVIESSSTSSRVLSEEWQREKIVANERAKAAKLNALAGVGSKVEQQGLVGGLGEFYTEVNSNKDLGKFDKVKTKAIGTFAAIGTAAGILGKALSAAFFYLELAVATFTFLNMAFSKNGKEVDALKSSLEGLTEATKTANNVAAKYGNTLSTESINAIATSFTTLADSVKQTSEQLNTALKASSWFDSIVNNVKKLWGGDLQSKVEEGLTGSILGAIKLLPEGEIKSSLEAKLKQATGAVNLTEKDLSKAFGKLSESAFQAKNLEINNILDATKKVLNNSQALTQDVKDTAKGVSEAYLSLSNSVKDNNPLTTFMSTSIKQALALNKALKDTYAAQVVLKDLASGVLKPQFLTEATAIQIMPLAEEASALSNQGKRFSDNLTVAKGKVADINKEIQKGGNYTWYDAQLRSQRLELKGIISESERGLASVNTRLQEITKQAQTLIKESIVAQIDESIKQTGLKINQLKLKDKISAVAELPVKTEASIKYSADLQRQSLEIDKLTFKSNETLVKSLDLLAVQVQRDADLRELEKISKEPSDQVSRSRQSMLTARVANADSAITAYSTKDVSTLKKLAYENPQLKGLIDSVQGAILANAGYDIQLKQINTAETQGKINLKYDNLIKDSENILKGLNTRLEAVVGTTAEADAARNALNEQIRTEQLRQQETLPAARNRELNQALSTRVGNAGVIAAGTTKLNATETTSKTLATNASGVKKANEDLAVNIKLKREEYDITNANYAINNLKTVAEETASKADIAYKTEQLNFLNSFGALSAQEYADKQRSLKLEEAAIERTQQLRVLTEAKTAAQQTYQLAVTAEGGKTNAVLEAQKKLYEATYTAGVEGANKMYDRTKDLIDIQSSLTEKQKSYEQVFKTAFDNMADTLIEFAKTGKFSFGDLANSIITEIARIELRAQTSSIWSALRPAVSAGLSSFFGISAGPEQLGGELVPKAKGGAYDYGVEAFAKGGMFTNSIVNTPTLFKFAKGTGLMGEAGPEAIMPLKRDSQGNLGVRGGGSNVEIVVNNYSTEKAETRETTDSRGNRKIEVIVGELAAADMVRSGSSSQKAVGGTFGLRPQLIRR